MNTTDTFHLDQDHHDLDPAEAEAIAIHEAVWLYQEGKLPADEAEEIKRLISIDPRAADSLRACQMANAHAASPAGQAYLQQRMALLEQQMARPKADCQVPAETSSRRRTEPSHSASSTPWSELWSRVKSLFGSGGDSPIPAGSALAQDKVPRSLLHLGNQVVSLLWKDEERGWVLRLLTNNPALTQLSYQFEGMEPKMVPLEKQADGCFRYETVLEASNPPSAHPAVSCAGK